jgi:hypothetical protein
MKLDSMKTKKRRPLLVLNFLKRSAYRAAVQPHTLGLAIALVFKFRYNANRSKGKKNVQPSSEASERLPEFELCY